MFNYNDKDFIQDLIKKALCEMCPPQKAYMATKIAICKRENVVVVQQICSKCFLILDEAKLEDVVIKQKL